MKRLFMAALVILWGAVWYLAMGQTTKPTTEVYSIGTVRMVKFTWHGARDSIKTAQPYSGRILRLVSVPGAGSSIPADNFDLLLLDQFGQDVLQGKGANVDSASTVYISGDSLGVLVSSQPILVVTNGGARVDSGVVYLYLQ